MPKSAVAIEFFAFIGLAAWLLWRQVLGARPRAPQAQAQSREPAGTSGANAPPGAPHA